MFKTAIAIYVCTLVSFFLHDSCGQDVTPNVPSQLNSFDISLSLPPGWTSEYPEGHDEISWLVRGRTDPPGIRVCFEIRVGEMPKSINEAKGIERLQNDFLDLKKVNSSNQQIAGEMIPVNRYFFKADTLSSDSGEVIQAILSHGGILVELRWYGAVSALVEAKSDLSELLASIKWIHADWKPSNSQVTFLKAAQKIVVGDASETDLVPLYEKAVLQDSGNTKARVLLANGYLDAGRIDDAFIQYKAVSRLDPTNPIAWMGMGHIVAEKGDNATALKYYTTAIAQAPTNDRAQIDYTVGLFPLHRYREALIHAELAKRLGWRPMQSLDVGISFLKNEIGDKEPGK